MTEGELLLEVSKNGMAMSALPENIQSEISEFASREEKRIQAESERRKRIEEEGRKENERRKKALDKERRELLCIGQWGERVPRNRRFALCERVGERFVGFSGEERDPSKWKDEIQYCAIDMVRGFTSPYWAYYGYSDHKTPFYTECIKPVLEAKTEDELVAQIRHNWNFFNVEKGNKGDNKPFCILEYVIDDMGYVKVTGKSETKTFWEHQEDLRREFEKGKS